MLQAGVRRGGSGEADLTLVRFVQGGSRISAGRVSERWGEACLGRRGPRVVDAGKEVGSKGGVVVVAALVFRTG